MTYAYFIGLDIGKASFDVALAATGQPCRFDNSAKGFAAFRKAFADYLPQALVVLEATGGYETALLTDLVGRGFAVHRATPLQARHFARSLRLHGKTDRLDALALARYGAERQTTLPLYVLPDATQQRLQEVLARRLDLVALRVAEQNRLAHPRYAALVDTIRPVLAVLEAQIALLDEALDRLIAQTPALAEAFAVLTNVKGVGRQTAYTLLAAMPELGTLTRRQAASLAGVAPHPRDSGSLRGYRRTLGGRAPVKRALFLAAMAARRFHPELRSFYERLLQNGKQKMVALTAVMRKLITILNAKLRSLHPSLTTG